jgi:hypothetical protein
MMCEREKYEQSVEGCEKKWSGIAWKYAWLWYGDQVMNGIAEGSRREEEELLDASQTFEEWQYG